MNLIEGYSDLLMAIMIYCLVTIKYIELSDNYIVGVDDDASEGFWGHIGMIKLSTEGYIKEPLQHQIGKGGFWMVVI